MTKVVPADAHGPISAALGKDDSRYWVYPNADGFRGDNLKQGLVAEFTRQGAEVRSQHARWGLETRGYGYGDGVHDVKEVDPQTNANRVEYRRGEMTEWYENGPLGLEQGFTLAHPPGKATGEPLTLELALRGDLVAAVESTGTSLQLKRKDGEVALRYTGLKARDATARELRSWLEVRGERLLLHVEDGDARYPIVVDPWIQQGELTASDGAMGDYFGQSIAMSGNLIVVGAPQHTVGSNSTQGAAYVFVQSGGIWSEQAELVASDGGAFDEFGSSVAVEGNTIVVGAGWRTVGSNNSQGAVYVFVESGGTWIQQAELTASDGGAFNYFGHSVALSGGTIVVGSPGFPSTGSNVAQGAVYVFQQNGANWNQQAELTASDGVAYDELGFSVAVSGGVALAGAPCHPAVGGCGPGAAYVLVENGGTWSLQTELAASDGEGNDEFGWSVALDTNTAVIGAHLHTVGSSQMFQGAAYVFVESGGIWSQQAELSASDGVPYDVFGFSVAVNGGTVIVGAYCHPAVSQGTCGPGALFVFTQSGTNWSQQAELTASDAFGSNVFFGSSVTLTGSIAAGGAPHHTVGSNQFQGEAYVFGSTGPMYALSASPNSLTVAQGNQGTSTIMITPENGFGGSVSLSASGLLSGVTAAFNPNPATSSSTLTLTADPTTATPGSVAVRVTGTSGNLTQTTSLALTVTGNPVQSYTLSVVPSSLNVTQGNQVTITITIAPLNGFTGNVSLSASGLPTGVTATFNPNPATSNSTLTLTAGPTATPGSVTVMVTGTSGNLTQSTPATLTVTPTSGDFTLGSGTGPTSQTIKAGQSASYTLTFASSNSFSGTVNLSCAITPAVATAPPTCTLPSSSVQISAGGTQSVVVSVATTAPMTTSVAAYAGFPSPATPLWGMLLLLSSVGLLLRKRKRIFAVPVLLAVALCVSCGGGTTPPPPHITPGTPSGTYAVTITATSGSVSHNLILQVIVQ